MPTGKSGQEVKVRFETDPTKEDLMMVGTFYRALLDGNPVRQDVLLNRMELHIADARFVRAFWLAKNAGLINSSSVGEFLQLSPSHEEYFQSLASQYPDVLLETAQN